MKKIYYLKTCDSCRKILGKLSLSNFELQEIKTQAITPQQLEELIALSGSAEALFSRRAKKYRQMGLQGEILGEKDYRQLLLEEYTFLKRPVIVDGSQLYIGNSAGTQKALEKAYGKG